MENRGGDGMNEIDILLRTLQGVNAATPLIVSLIAAIKGGRAAGKTDDEIEAESMRIALETRSITEADMSDAP